MQQIIAGSRRGAKLTPLEADAVRPTAQRTRAALFNILAGGRYHIALAGAHVLDMFAGSGALGLEAISRGAARAVFVEQDPAAIKVLRANIEKLGFASQCQLIAGPVQSLSGWTGQPADILMLDAPYKKGLSRGGLEAAHRAAALRPDSLAFVETHKSERLELPAEFQLADRRQYGIAALHILTYRPLPANG